MCNSHYMKGYRHGDVHFKAVLPHRDYTGIVAGTLTAVEFVEDSHGKWLWQCSCGNTRVQQPYLVLVTGDNATCGDKVKHAPPSYQLSHNNVKRVKGRASDYTCSCGEPAKQWAYDHLDPDEHHASNMSANPMPYSMNPDHYVAMCIKCHKKLDLAFLRG